MNHAHRWAALDPKLEGVLSRKGSGELRRRGVAASPRHLIGNQRRRETLVLVAVLAKGGGEGHHIDSTIAHLGTSFHGVTQHSTQDTAGSGLTTKLTTFWEEVRVVSRLSRYVQSCVVSVEPIACRRA